MQPYRKSEPHPYSLGKHSETSARALGQFLSQTNQVRILSEMSTLIYGGRVQATRSSRQNSCHRRNWCSRNSVTSDEYARCPMDLLLFANHARDDLLPSAKCGGSYYPNPLLEGPSSPGAGVRLEIAANSRLLLLPGLSRTSLYFDTYCFFSPLGLNIRMVARCHGRLREGFRDTRFPNRDP